MVGPNNLGDDSLPVAKKKKHRTDNLKPGTEQFYKRQLRHRHNRFTGTVATARAGMNQIIQASTTTTEAKKLAGQILSRLSDLGEELKTRVD